MALLILCKRSEHEESWRYTDLLYTTKLLRRFTTLRVGRFLPGVFPHFPSATNTALLQNQSMGESSADFDQQRRLHYLQKIKQTFFFKFVPWFFPFLSFCCTYTRQSSTAYKLNCFWDISEFAWFGLDLALWRADGKASRPRLFCASELHPDAGNTNQSNHSSLCLSYPLSLF